MLFIADARGEVHRTDIAAVCAIARRERPQLIDLDRAAPFVLQRAQKRTRGRIERVDGAAVGKVTHQQRAAEYAKARRGYRDAPRRIERPVVDAEGQVAHAIHIEPAHETVAHTVLRLAVAAHFRIRHIKRAADTLDVVRVIHIAHRVRYGGIGERK